GYKTNLPEFLHVGPRGEHTINILANSMNLNNVNDLLYRGNDAKSVLQQTIEWLGYIFDGAKIDIKGRDKESSVLYMLLNNKNNSYTYKPANVGFGYSYVLPLIVTGLIAKPGEIIIIENPEAHLHPKAQARIAEFFAKIASCGVQVFIESHSEHILNGLRVSALNPEIAISTKDISIHYFNESFKPEKLEMNEKAKILNWPNGFFDQQENDLAEIFKYSR
uniref:AAA family ATPase n=1 Tax=Candidatus Symbiothrix dinenymphae TaxID=467085 RepID=UPI00131525A3